MLLLSVHLSQIHLQILIYAHIYNNQNVRLRDANSHNILSFSKIQLPASRTRTFCISLLTSCFFASLCSRRSETAGFLLLCRIRSGKLCSLSPDLIWLLPILLFAHINNRKTLQTRKSLYNFLRLPCDSLAYFSHPASLFLFLRPNFPFSIFNFPRGGVGLSCIHPATLLGRSWDDCQNSTHKPLIINLTFPDF